MQLILDRIDLKEEHKHVPCSKTKAEHFKEDIQVAIALIGWAVFYEHDRSNYNRIYHNPI